MPDLDLQAYSLAIREWASTLVDDPERTWEDYCEAEGLDFPPLEEIDAILQRRADGSGPSTEG